MLVLEDINIAQADSVKLSPSLHKNVNIQAWLN